MSKTTVRVAVDAPLYQAFDYGWDSEKLGTEPRLGQLVAIEFGRKKTVGVVTEILSFASEESKPQAWELKEVLSLAPLPELNADLMRLARFAAEYYIKPMGEILLSAIPAQWKQLEKWQGLAARAEKKREQLIADSTKKVNKEKKSTHATPKYVLTDEQQNAVMALRRASDEKEFAPILLQGITGSGKTAVYLDWIKYVLETPKSQCLLLVPEINLTPQLVSELEEVFPDKTIVVMHSDVTAASRSQAWYLSHIGQADLIVGTRLSVMASIPNLRAIVVDEENDPSYKQQEGVRYSARDLAIWRAADKKIPVLLASATPSCETWEKVQAKKIELLELSKRAREGAKIPEIHLIDLKQEKLRQRIDQFGLTQTVKEAITRTLDRNLQVLIFINRRGFAPVLSCAACDWKSACPKCSAYLVVHKKNTLGSKTMLHCHHCGLVSWVPKNCPECGNQDIGTLGRGTQKIEEAVAQLYPQAKILRVDTDATKKKGTAATLFEKIHDGDADIIVGTQMLAKGHDFDLVDTVVVLDADKSLYSQDFRSTERLFSQLIQVAGRGGRSEKSIHPRIFIQTEIPNHALYQAVVKKDVQGYLTTLLEERKLAGLPPFSSQALIIADGKDAKIVMKTLHELRQELAALTNWPAEVEIYDAVPRTMAKVAGRERAQILLEAKARPQLQIALTLANEVLERKRKKSRSIRLVIERDPSAY